MKLKVPKLYSQRDPQWAPELLGYNTNPAYSIGGYGCLITSFGMYIDQTPHEVNEVLKANGGYVAGGGYIIWSKCTVLGLKQDYQSPVYKDVPVTPQGLTKMRGLLDEGKPLITHIDFDPRDPDDDQHWLLVYGYDDNDVFYARDPWTGTEINLDVYGGVKRAVIEWRAYDKVLPRDEVGEVVCMPKAQADDFNRVKDGWNQLRVKLNIEDNVTLVLSELDKLIGYEDAVIQKDKQVIEAQGEIADLRMRLGLLTDSHNALQTSYNDLQIQLSKDNDTISILSTKLASLEKQILAPVRKGWKATLVALIDKL